jgi:hypothetical protein
MLADLFLRAVGVDPEQGEPGRLTHESTSDVFSVPRAVAAAPGLLRYPAIVHYSAAPRNRIWLIYAEFWEYGRTNRAGVVPTLEPLYNGCVGVGFG